jgi:fucose permease
MGCPFLVAAAGWRTSIFLYGLAGALALLAMALGVVRFRADAKEESVAQAKDTPVSLWAKPLAPTVAALFFIYVGTETSIGGWVASYARRVDTHSFAFWTMVPAFFWGALLLGRALAPLALRRVREGSLATAGLGLASCGVVVLLGAKNISFIVLGSAMAGLGLSSVYPITISMLAHWFGESAGRVGAALFPIGNLGGAVMPWMVGALSSRFGSLRWAFSIPLFGVVFMLGVYLAHGKSRGNAPEAA